MINAVILDKDTLGQDIDLSPITNICSATIYQNTAPEQVAQRIKDTDVVIINKIKLCEQNLADAKNLKLICIAATGFDNIDINYCKSRGIAVCNVPGYSSQSVAQVTVAMALSLVTHLKEYTQCVTSGQYSRSGIANKLTPVYHELCGMRWGVVGGGGIATAVAKIAQAFGCDVIMCRQKNEGDFPLCDIDTLCKTCDIISIHVPLNEGTKHLINKSRIDSMKNTAIVINTARGAVTDEAALADAVKSGKIAGIGVDVYSKEPFDTQHPFYSIMQLDNVLLTPHMAWGSYESRMRCINKIATNISCFFNGEINNRIV